MIFYRLFLSPALREKCPNTEFFSVLYFPIFSPYTGKYGPEKTSYSDTFHAVPVLPPQTLEDYYRHIATYLLYTGKLF